MKIIQKDKPTYKKSTNKHQRNNKSKIIVDFGFGSRGNYHCVDCHKRFRLGNQLGGHRSRCPMKKNRSTETVSQELDSDNCKKL